MQKIASLLLSVKAEALKINWPTRKQVMLYTGIVLAVSVAVAAILGLLDVFFGWAFQKVIIGA